MSMSREPEPRKRQSEAPAGVSPKLRLLPFSENGIKFYPFLHHTSSSTRAIEAAAGFLQDQRYERHQYRANQASVMLEVVSQLISDAIGHASAPGEREELEKAQRCISDADDAMSLARSIWTEHECPSLEAEAAVHEFITVMHQFGERPAAPSGSRDQLSKKPT